MTDSEIVDVCIKHYEEALKYSINSENAGELKKWLQERHMLYGICFFLYPISLTQSTHGIREDDSLQFHRYFRAGYICRIPFNLFSVVDIVVSLKTRVNFLKNLKTKINENLRRKEENGI